MHFSRPNINNPRALLWIEIVDEKSTLEIRKIVGTRGLLGMLSLYKNVMSTVFIYKGFMNL